jgi:hypothetical protein
MNKNDNGLTGKTSQEQLGKMGSDIFTHCLSLMERKGKDYAPGKYAFDNFDKSSQLMGILGIDVANPLHIALFHVVGKVLRLIQLGTNTPNNESVADSCADIIVYSTLYKGMYDEIVNGEKQ